MNDAPMKLTTSQVSLILQRAAEIDARGDTMRIDELERIAAEAGIDTRATRTAIAEFIAEEMPAAKPQVPPAAEPRPGTSASPSSGRIVAGGAVGLAFGFIISQSTAGGALGFGSTVIYLMLRAVQSLKRGNQLDFQLQNFAVWFGVAMGGLATDVLFAEEIIGPVFVVWLITSFLGGLLVRFGPREEEPEEEVPQIEAGGR
ncbi:hypothetical protein [Candidatus Palauibacter sp.]|uniref:hypothetical protein n=1 Tax=Candidatus Palauibacter sp. TaxID=3101350 RepID=UPI003AF28FDC